MADSTVETTSSKPQEDWMSRRWRPMMGWMYMVVCTFDFMVAPILWSVLQTATHQTITQWQPLTLQGAGLFHLAMGAVLGVAAYGRTQEKLGGANNGGLQLPQPTTLSIPAPANNANFSTTATAASPPGFGSAEVPGSFATSSSGSTPFPDTTPAVTTGFGGKPAPVIPPFPEK